MKLPGIIDKDNCCGCRACEEICSKKAISMTEDERGFYYPVINKDRCVICGRCEKVCPNINRPNAIEVIRCAFAAVHIKDAVLFQSNSGGAFMGLIEAWKPDFVCGVKWECFRAVNDIAAFQDDTACFSKSKYIMSDTNGIFTKARSKLKEGYKVLFSGSPCQIAAFRNFLEGAEYNNLLLVDIVCHGVPSDKLLQKHIKEIEQKQKQKVLSWTFRDKTCINGNVEMRSARIKFDNGTEKHVGISDDAYLKMYYSRLAYR